MKFHIIKTAFLCTLTGIFLNACQKDDSEKDYGFSVIYMPQAIFKSGGVNANYPVPSGTDSSTYNYQIDSKTNRVNIILGATLSGPAAAAYSVNVGVNNDTIQRLLTTQQLDPNLYILMPSSMYTLPEKLDVVSGERSGTFFLSVDISQLKAKTYEGKYLVLAVNLSNPTNYTLNPTLSTAVVIIDVNALVIGPAVNITSKYILNPGNPFVASGMMSGSTRWGSLKNWTANAAALSHGGYGGYSNDGDGATMDLESGWGSPLISNGKLYQTVTLPAGTYAFDPSGGAWTWQGTKDAAYVVAAPGLDTLPDYNNIIGNANIMYQQIVKPQTLTYFQLTTTTKVTLGIVVNYVQDQQGIKSKLVTLYNFPKHL